MDRKLRERTRTKGGTTMPISRGGSHILYAGPTSGTIVQQDFQTGDYVPFLSRERVVDEVRTKVPFLRELGKGPFIHELRNLDSKFGDIGGEFFVKRETARRSLGSAVTGRRQRYMFDNMMTYTNADTSQSFSNSWFLADPRSDLDPYGAKGWSRYQPLAPEASLGQALVELRELPKMGLTTFRRLPQILKEQNAKYRDLGDQYLNVEFGWRPFLNDVRDVFDLGHLVSKRITQLVRDNGRGVRRGGPVHKFHDSSSTVTPTVGIGPTGETYLQTNTGAQTVENYSYKERIWFSARFRYFIPNTKTPLFAARQALAALGLDPTPSLLWDVMPWSWLVDWFSNVGDVIENLCYGSADNLVADYAYCMRHTREKWVKTANRQYSTGISFLSIPSPNPRVSVSTQISFEREEKVRIRATPFGFGLLQDSLSARQWAILVALGLTTYPRLIA